MDKVHLISDILNALKVPCPCPGQQHSENLFKFFILLLLLFRGETVFNCCSKVKNFQSQLGWEVLKVLKSNSHIFSAVTNGQTLSVLIWKKTPQQIQIWPCAKNILSFFHCFLLLYWPHPWWQICPSRKLMIRWNFSQNLMTTDAISAVQAELPSKMLF